MYPKKAFIFIHDGASSNHEEIELSISQKHGLTPHHSLFVTPSMVYSWRHRNRFNDLEGLEHVILGIRGKCASNLKIIIKARK